MGERRRRTPAKRYLLKVLSLLILSAGPGAATGENLNEIHKIYLGDFGSGEGADLVREKLRVRLMESGRFSVVESVEAADAVLTGAAGVSRAYYSNESSGGTTYQGYGVLRLLYLRTQQPVWLFQYKRGFSFGGSSSRVAKQIAEKLLKDAEAAARAAIESGDKRPAAGVEKR